MPKFSLLTYAGKLPIKGQPAGPGKSSRVRTWDLTSISVSVAVADVTTHLCDNFVAEVFDVTGVLAAALGQEVAALGNLVSRIKCFDKLMTEVCVALPLLKIARSLKRSAYVLLKSSTPVGACVLMLKSRAHGPLNV